MLVPSGELDYWRGDTPEGAPEVLKKQFQTAHRVIAPLVRAWSAWPAPYPTGSSSICFAHSLLHALRTFFGGVWPNPSSLKSLKLFIWSSAWALVPT